MAERSCSGLNRANALILNDFQLVSKAPATLVAFLACYLGLNVVTICHPMADRARPYIVKSLVHASKILEAFQSSGEVLRLRDIVERTGFGKGMCFRLLMSGGTGLSPRSAAADDSESGTRPRVRTAPSPGKCTPACCAPQSANSSS
jgi:hypothetical protein